jgi:hypothetical protein
MVWWRRGGDQVAATYEEVFPRSCRGSFWRVVASAVTLFLCVVLQKLKQFLTGY